MFERINILDYAAELALTAAKRSEDPWLKVGAVAFTSDNRIVAMGYNGLLSGYSFEKLQNYVGKERDDRLPFMVHAEQNLCSLFERGRASWVMLTHSPCSSCLLLLLTHKIQKIYFLEEYLRDQNSQKLAKFYAASLIQHRFKLGSI